MRTRKGHRPGALFVVALLVVTAAAAVSGCGGIDSSRIVARVRHVGISERAVRHWAVVLERGGTGTPPAPGAAAASRAEEYLIASRWLLAEASRLGVAPTRQVVRARLGERREAVPGGQAAFAESLASSGRTVADVELEIEAELAAQALRRAVLQRAGTISPAAVAAAYRREIARYRTPERRYVDLVERLKSAAAARRLAQRVGPGAPLARLAYHEVRARPPRFNASEKGRVERAIFAAQPGVLVGPMRLNREWTLFVVRRIVPAGVKPLRAVEASIAARLRAAGRAEALRRFVIALHERWRPVTRCSAGFVVPQCNGRHGAAGVGMFGGLL